jgi:hypothetical protein
VRKRGRGLRSERGRKIKRGGTEKERGSERGGMFQNRIFFLKELCRLF